MIRGIKRSLQTLDLPLRADIHNRFDVEVVDSNTGLIKQKAVGHNIICNALWDRVLGFKNFFNYIHYGGGSGTPASSDTSLFSYIGGASCSGVDPLYSLSPVTGVYSARRSIQLTASTAAGRTITEVGIAYDSGSSTLCTHAMLKDMNGNPISIEKSSTDVVNIYATVFAHIDPLGYDGMFYPWPTVDEFWGNSFIDWLLGIDSITFNAVWFSPDGTGSYTYLQYGKGRPKRYVQKSASTSVDIANRRLTITAGRLESSEANYGGLRLIDIGLQSSTGATYARPTLMSFPKWFTGRVTQEAVGTGDGSTTDFGLAIGFAKNARVYIDGVETTDFEVINAPNTADWTLALHGLTPDSTPECHIYSPIKGGDGLSKGEYIFYNPWWEIGLSTLQTYTSATLYVSDDLRSWTQISRGTIEEQYAHKKYWKLNCTQSSGYNYFKSVVPLGYDGKALKLGSPPPAGAAIIADYECDCIPKDANHVFDMTVTIQLGEYTEAQ